jgi:SH3-like domain-containing protein
MRISSISLALTCLIVIVLAPSMSGAQRSVTSASPLLATPGGRTVATVRPAATLDVGATRGAYAQVTLEGWVSAALLGSGRDSFPIAVKSAATGVRLRATAASNAPVIAELRGGMGLTRVARRGDWVQVRRTAWVRQSALASEPRVAASPRPATSNDMTRAAAGSLEVAQMAPPAAAPDSALPMDALTPASTATLRSGPDGRTIGSVSPTAVLTPTARERGWIRVRVEGWIRESEVLPADTALRAALSAADLRADPDGTRGKIVRWEVEMLAFQIADPLRKGLVPDEPYLLARGPGEENALLYLALPPSLVAIAKSLPALAPITVTARVRTGRSEPVGVPILDIQTLVRR